jgi:hypothetical protein
MTIDAAYGADIAGFLGCLDGGITRGNQAKYIMCTAFTQFAGFGAVADAYRPTDIRVQSIADRGTGNGAATQGCHAGGEEKCFQFHGISLHVIEITPASWLAIKGYHMNIRQPCAAVVSKG